MQPLHRAAQLDRDRQLAQLKAAAPLRKPVAQHDVDGLALFDVARQPSLF